jgi:hypothetical protein
MLSTRKGSWPPRCAERSAGVAEPTGRVIRAVAAAGPSYYLGRYASWHAAAQAVGRATRMR